MKAKIWKKGLLSLPLKVLINIIIHLSPQIHLIKPLHIV